MSLIAELKRRNVFRVGAAYGIVGWLLVEVASVLLPTFGVKVVSFLVILGLPLAVILAWAFELTPEGIKRDSAVESTESIRHSTGRKLDFAIIALLAVALTYVVLDKYVLEVEPQQAKGIAERAPGAESAALEKSVAVLPFANRSVKAEDAFFVDGMHDDILTHLSKIQSLKVISRTSVMEYRDTEKNMKTIGGRSPLGQYLRPRADRGKPVFDPDRDCDGDCRCVAGRSLTGRAGSPRGCADGKPRGV